MRISDWSSDVCSSDLIVGAREAKAEKNGVVVALQCLERQLAPEALPQYESDAADGQDIGGLALGEVVDRLVGGDAVLVEAAGLFPPVDQIDVMTMQRQAVSAGEAGGAGTDHRHAPARRGRAGEEL